MHFPNVLTHKKILLGTLFTLGLLLVGAKSASAATLQISSNASTLAPGELATLNVYVNAAGTAINSSEGTITFPANLFNVVSVSKGNSIFSIWVEEPSFSNGDGTITFNGGLPTPGYSGSSGSVISITVRAKQAGSGTFAFGDVAVRANDGYGTNVLTSRSGKTITVAAPATPAPTPVPTPTPTPPVPPTNTPPTTVPTTPSAPGLISITSPTHPNTDQWYNDKNPKLTWLLPAGTDAVQISMDTDSATTPRVLYGPPITSKVISELTDGVWYFKLRARKGGVWGPVSTRIVRIDTKAPVSSNMVFAYSDTSKVLSLAATVEDSTSGVDRFDIAVDGTLVKSVPAAEFVNGNYSLPIIFNGTAVVTLTAYDRAGNSVQASRTFSATGAAAATVIAPPALVPVNQQLIVRGMTKNPNTLVTVYLKRGDDVVTLLATSGADLNFSVLTPQLAAGDYEIWAETGLPDAKVASNHVRTTATARTIVSIGTHTFTGLTALLLLLVLLVLACVGGFFFGHHLRALYYKAVPPALLVSGDKPRALMRFKRRLEKHLEIMQRTRLTRMLTKEEKAIKEALEVDLDEVDKAIANGK